MSLGPSLVGEANAYWEDGARTQSYAQTLRGQNEVRREPETTQNAHNEALFGRSPRDLLQNFKSTQQSSSLKFSPKPPSSSGMGAFTLGPSARGSLTARPNKYRKVPRLSIDVPLQTARHLTNDGLPMLALAHDSYTDGTTRRLWRSRPAGKVCIARPAQNGSARGWNGTTLPTLDSPSSRQQQNSGRLPAAAPHSISSSYYARPQAYLSGYRL